MQAICAGASALAAQLSMNSRITIHSHLLKLPTRYCKSAMKYGDMKIAQLSHFSQSCCPLLQTSSRKTALQSHPCMLYRLLHSVQTQTLNRNLEFWGTSRSILFRVRLRVIGASSTDSIVGRRLINGDARDKDSYHRRTGLIYLCAAGIFMLGMSYAGVPLYRMLCQATGLGGTVSRGHDASKVESMQPVPERVIRIRFNADVGSSMRWNFKPQQTEVKVLPGETALAFYTAKNPTDKPIIGISTYNVVPFEAGQYFNKIQCFCFEEQRLNPHEQVDMPVFFYIDPEFADDPKLKGVETITLSYTFFEAKEGFQVPLPGYMTQAQ